VQAGRYACLCRPVAGRDKINGGHRSLAFEKTSSGDRIYTTSLYDGHRYVYEGVKPGDLIIRALDVEWGGCFRRIMNRFIVRAVPGRDEHVSLYIGDGKIINVGPDDPNSVILEKGLDYTMGSFDPDQIHICRMSEDRAVSERAVRFYRFHASLSARVTFGTDPELVHLPEPIIFEGEQFKAYYSEFNCVQAAVLAYRLQDRVNALQGDDQVSSVAAFIINPTEANLQEATVSNIWTGYHLVKLAEREILPQRV